MGVIFGIIILAVVAIFVVPIVVWPAQRVWNLSKSVAHRLSGDEDNLLVMFPVFAGVMLALAGLDLIFLVLPETTGVPSGQVANAIKLNIGVSIAVYCIGSVVLPLIGGLYLLVFSICAAIFTALNNALEAANNAIRGDH